MFSSSAHRRQRYINDPSNNSIYPEDCPLTSNVLVRHLGQCRPAYNRVTQDEDKWVSAHRARESEEDARQAGGALDAGKNSGDEDGVEAEVYEFSEHFWVMHRRTIELCNGWERCRERKRPGDQSEAGPRDRHTPFRHMFTGEGKTEQPTSGLLLSLREK